MQTDALRAMAAYLLVGFVVLAGAIAIAYMYSKRQDDYLALLRAERGMRSPVAEWVKDFEKRNKARRPVGSETSGSVEAASAGVPVAD